MNEFNLIRLKRYGVLAEITNTQNGSPVLLINFPVTGGGPRQAAFQGPPRAFKTDKFSVATAHINDADRQRFFESDPSCEVAAEVLDALARHGKALASAANNNKLSGDGRLELAIEASSQALVTIGTQYATLQRIGSGLERQHSELYATPAADAAETAVDVETRGLLRSLEDHEVVSLLTKPEAPAHTRVVLALKRAVFPLREDLAKFLEDAWTARVCAQAPERAATLKIAEDNHDWANRLTLYIASIVASPSLSGTNGAISRFDAYKILKPTGGLDVLRFSQGEIAMFERLLAQAAA